MAARTFEKFMEQVDAELIATVGIDSNDLPDWGYWDAWDAGESAKDVARDVLEENGFEV